MQENTGKSKPACWHIFIMFLSGSSEVFLMLENLRQILLRNKLAEKFSFPSSRIRIPHENLEID